MKRWLLPLLVLLANCIQEPDYAGYLCDDTKPCPGSLVCASDGTCQISDSADTGADAAVSMDADAADAQQPIDSGPDTGPDAGPDVGPDTGPEDVPGGDADASPDAGNNVCGDGTVEAPEEACDDGNDVGGDGCSADCTTIESGYACPVPGSLCETVCGDGLLRGLEQCDDQNAIALDGCTDCAPDPNTACSGEPSVCIPWFDTAWTRRRLVTVDNGTVTALLDDFPIPVRLNATTIDYAVMIASGDDLRFVAADHATVIPYEIERFVPGDDSLAWIRADVPASGTAPAAVWMYYGNQNAAPAAAPDQVFAAGFEGVWHLGGLAPLHADSSGGGHDGTTTGMDAADRVPAMLGDGQDFDGVDDMINVGSYANTGWTEITMSSWIFYRGAFTLNDRVLCKSPTTLPAEHIFCLQARPPLVDDPGQVLVRLATNQVQATSLFGDTPGLVAPGWYHIAATWRAADNTLRFYLDGAPDGTANVPGASLVVSNQEVIIGNVNLIESRYVDAILDEVRLSSVARGAPWIAYQHRADTIGVTAIGAEETVP